MQPSGDGEERASGGSPSEAGNLSSLLLDLAGHHERLQQVNVDLGAALAAAQASTVQMKEYLKRNQPPPQEVPQHLTIAESEAEVEAGAEEYPRSESREEAEFGSEFGICSEWHRKVLKRQPSMKASLRPLSAKTPDSVPELAVVESLALPSSELEQRHKLNGALDDDFAELPAPRISSMSSESNDDETWDSNMNIVLNSAIQRLQDRLGKTSTRGGVTPLAVHSALVNMGLNTYSQTDVESWLDEVSSAYTEHENRSSLGKFSLRRRGRSSFIPEQHLRCVQETVHRANSTRSSISSHNPGATLDLGRKNMRFKVFLMALLNDRVLAHLSADLQRMSQTIREILFSGHSNKLVADITRIHVGEVAAPMEPTDFAVRIEPFVAFIILLNGIFIGVQTSATDIRSTGDAWFWGNAAFTFLMILELTLKLRFMGWRHFTRSADRWWNLFDSLMVSFAVVDIFLEALWRSADLGALAVMRTVRLTRITRLIRLFRLRFMKELNLMVRGLIGGLQTLFWATMLLFFTLYVIGVLVTTLINMEESNMAVDVAQDELFSSVPRAIFTAFRCFMGDCNTSAGRPIIKLMADAHGEVFVIGYLASTVFVVFGLFNLIVAVYVENTMHAARTDGTKTPDENYRDALRVAKQTRQLLKKFCAADRLWSTGHRKSDAIKAMRASAIDDVPDFSMQVSKEMYLTVIQDPGVQKLMDDIDIPPERDHLFDVLDADCSGGLEVTELISGLLRVRGESRKSDAVGTLLAVRATQDMLRDQNDRLSGLELQLEQVKNAEARLLRRKKTNSQGGSPNLSMDQISQGSMADRICWIPGQTRMLRTAPLASPAWSRNESPDKSRGETPDKMKPK